RKMANSPTMDNCSCTTNNCKGKRNCSTDNYKRTGRNSYNKGYPQNRTRSQAHREPGNCYRAEEESIGGSRPEPGPRRLAEATQLQSHPERPAFSKQRFPLH